MAKPPCQSIPGLGLDEAVSQVMLDAATPAALDVALEVFEELRARKAEVDRLRRAQVERAREEVELAQRQYMLVRPENRLVADTLERQWNEKLAQLTQAEEEFARARKAEGPDLSEEARERIHALASDLPRVWKDPRTPARERKRMLRLLIEDVTLVRAEKIRMHIRWKGGATTSLERPLPLAAFELRRTPAATVEMIRALAAKKPESQIASALNARSLRSGTGEAFTRRIVWNLRMAYGILSPARRLRQAGWLKPGEIAALLGVHYQTAKDFGREGVLRAMRVDEKGSLLFEPPTGPLPKAQPGKRFRDRRRYPQCPAIKREEVQYAA